MLVGKLGAKLESVEAIGTPSLSKDPTADGGGSALGIVGEGGVTADGLGGGGVASGERKTGEGDGTLPGARTGEGDGTLPGAILGGGICGCWRFIGFDGEAK